MRWSSLFFKIKPKALTNHAVQIFLLASFVVDEPQNHKKEKKLIHNKQQKASLMPQFASNLKICANRAIMLLSSNVKLLLKLGDATVVYT